MGNDTTPESITEITVVLNEKSRYGHSGHSLLVQVGYFVK